MNTTDSTTPIACNLDALSPAERARRSELARDVQKRARSLDETETGYRMELPNDPSACAAALDLILLERRCCPFLSLELVFEPGDGAVMLGIGGPPGAKDFLRDNGLLGAASDTNDCC
jgi:hypothetical protein